MEGKSIKYFSQQCKCVFFKKLFAIKNLFFQQWNQLSRFQRNILYFLIITIILVIFYLLPGDNKNGVLDESDYNNIEVVQDTLKYEKVQLIRYK